jgi:hypothetical protein
MSRESFLLRSPLKYEFLLFIAQLGRGMEEIVISGRHRAAVHDCCDPRSHCLALLPIKIRPIREVQRPSGLVCAEQVRRREFRVPGTAPLIRMAVEARAGENFIDLRVCRESIRRGRSKHQRCRATAIRAFGNQSRSQKRKRDTGRKKVAPDFVFRDQTMHRSVSRNMRVLCGAVNGTVLNHPFSGVSIRLSSNRPSSKL